MKENVALLWRKMLFYCEGKCSSFVKENVVLLHGKENIVLLHGKENVVLLGRKMLFYCMGRKMFRYWEGKCCSIVKENIALFWRKMFIVLSASTKLNIVLHWPNIQGQIREEALLDENYLIINEFKMQKSTCPAMTSLSYSVQMVLICM